MIQLQLFRPRRCSLLSSTICTVKGANAAAKIQTITGLATQKQAHFFPSTTVYGTFQCKKTEISQGPFKCRGPCHLDHAIQTALSSIIVSQSHRRQQVVVMRPLLLFLSTMTKYPPRLFRLLGPPVKTLQYKISYVRWLLGFHLSRSSTSSGLVCEGISRSTACAALQLRAI